MAAYDWNCFVEDLGRRIDWDSERCFDGEEIRSLLERVRDNQRLLKDRVVELSTNQTLFEHYRPLHSYPRILMDKIVIYQDPQDRFRIRLHRFAPRRVRGDSREKVHSHKWPAVTLVLAGSYREQLFSVEHMDIERGVARLKNAELRRLEAGAIDVKKIDTPHQVFNDHETQWCYTLFVRGRSFRGAGAVFDPVDDRCWPWLGAEQSLRHGLMAFAELSNDFM